MHGMTKVVCTHLQNYHTSPMNTLCVHTVTAELNILSN